MHDAAAHSINADGLSEEALAAVSHDLRSPLTGVMLSASLLEERAAEAGDSEIAELAADVARGTRRAALLVDDLLDYARCEAGAMQLTTEPVDLGAVVTEAIEDVRLSRSHLQVQVVRPESPVIARGDDQRLRTVFRNLLENAARYGQPPFRVRIVPAGKQIEVHIEDAGPGIPDAEREVIFGRFRRGSTTRGTTGSGLGLYISRKLIELHGGSVSVGESELGGADFVVRLPAARSGPA